MTPIQEIRNTVLSQETRIKEDFLKFLRFQSISTDPQYKSELMNCYQWVKEKVCQMGFEVQTWAQEDFPIIFASHGFDPNKPTWIFYQHYDVQPVDPLELWKNPPFEPFIDEEGTVYARGAQDNKGQCMATLSGLDTYLRLHGSFPFNIRLLIEGQEECGSGKLKELLEQKRNELQANGCILVDVDMPSMQEPSITLGVRGMLAMDLEILEAKHDLHSGLHGNLAYNPNKALAQLISSFFDEDGRIAIEGFYDGIEKLSPSEKEALDMDFQSQRYEKEFGMKAEGGWRKHEPLERLWLDPSLEINGLSGGYCGQGFKTVIPASARAKISCRLVAGQDPQDIAKKIKQHIEKQLYPTLRFHLDVHEGVGKALLTSSQASIAHTFKQAVSEERELYCKTMLSGASIPIAASLQEISGADVIGIGYGLSTDCIHAPNEHYSISRLIGLATAICKAIELAGQNYS